jgi:hypothetical protein
MDWNLGEAKTVPVLNEAGIDGRNLFIDSDWQSEMDRMTTALNNAGVDWGKFFGEKVDDADDNRSQPDRA